MSRAPVGISMEIGGVSRALNQINQYKEWLNRKAEELRKRVGELIRDKAAATFAAAIADDIFAVIDDDGKTKPATPRIGGVSVTLEPNSDGFTIVIATGKAAIWMEFGAGVHHNGAVGSFPHPRAQAIGMSAIGTYGDGRGKQDIWVFKDTDGTLYATHGTPASMPMYNAMMAVWSDIILIAEEVFNA